MSSKSRKEKKAASVAAAPPQSLPQPLFTKGQIQTILAGALLTIAGFVVLSQADPAAKNWAGKLCPFLILGGYAVIGVALWKGKN